MLWERGTGFRYTTLWIDQSLNWSVIKVNVEKVVKRLGLGCMVAGFLRMGMTPSSMIWGFDSPQELTFGLSACILMGVFSLAFFLAQSKETGVPGLITVLAIMIGNILTACIIWGFLTYGEYGEEGTFLDVFTMIASSAGVLGGAVVLPILTWRAKVFPRWVVAAMVSMVASLAIPETGFFAFFWGLPYVAAGYCIWTGRLNRRTNGQGLEAAA